MVFGNMPDCLRYRGDAPAGWVQTPDSREMQACDDWGIEDTVAGAEEGATDGSSKGGQGS